MIEIAIPIFLVLLLAFFCAALSPKNYDGDD